MQTKRLGWRVVGLAAGVLALTLGPRVTQGDETKTGANVPVEISFRAASEHADPFGLTLDVLFQTPTGRSLRVPAFWAGNGAWKVRYASGEVGIHRYRSECADANDQGLHGIEGHVEIAAYDGGNPLFKHGPIRVADDRRHFEHTDGTPFFWLGDTWWMGLCHRLHFPDEFARLTTDRKAKGFTVVQIVAGLYPDMHPFDPRGANEAGFPWEKDYARIRPEYFDAADGRIRHLVDQGLSPCIVGMWGYFQPWMGTEKAKAHWRYLVARYGAWPVTWCVAGEANLPWYLAKGFPFDDREQVHGWTEVLRYVRTIDPFRRPLTIHPTALGPYTARHATDDSGLLDFDMLQTPHGQREAADVTLQAARDSYAAKPTMPVIDGEASYEQLLGQIPAEWTRAMFWICMASGSAGHTYGANGIWQCNRREQPHGNSPTGGTYGTIPWDDAMKLPGSSQVGAGKKFLEGFPWHRFEPLPDSVAWDDQAPDPAPELGHWVWFPEGDARQDAPVAARSFRKSIDLPAGKVRRARLRIGADDHFTAWVNGRQVGAAAGWKDHDPIDVTSDLIPGRNAIAVRVENRPAPVALNPAGLIAGLSVEYEDGRVVRLGTGPDWRSSRDESPQWREPGFDDSGWSTVADLGPAGSNPWGAITSRPLFPPLAFGLAEGPKIIYALHSKPILIRGLTANRSYRLIGFDPVTGHSQPLGEIKAGTDGTARHPGPDHGHDWVLAIVP
ncbi:apiosidase-like domain-containing protein [Singulisphaera acidiphila]|uniref:Alpha-L-rhamnosidase family protein n=1 Tax=Singulisphaera acidiphila (strain ATCC BAA-1392 / DSM 18658 / VKM B-2454 / MOB10) TaxID=886293 RepID=L0DD02_SINAD|nr:DUF4038 domain-containing protein [Singulisphaera acidiphila]AGA26745.1 alpha-L-rhamnosidase family protein [Singulisphaera acidiphila DSM 18658]